MAYMSEEGYQKLVAELKHLESVDVRRLWLLLQKHVIKAICQRMQNTMPQKRHKACWK